MVISRLLLLPGTLIVVCSCGTVQKSVSNHDALDILRAMSPNANGVKVALSFIDHGSADVRLAALRLLSKAVDPGARLQAKAGLKTHKDRLLHDSDVDVLAYSIATFDSFELLSVVELSILVMHGQRKVRESVLLRCLGRPNSLDMIQLKQIALSDPASGCSTLATRLIVRKEPRFVLQIAEQRTHGDVMAASAALEMSSDSLKEMLPLWRNWIRSQRAAETLCLAMVARHRNDMLAYRATLVEISASYPGARRQIGDALKGGVK